MLFFFNCKFNNNISISNIRNFNDTYLFIDCIFERNIDFISDNIESNLFDNCSFKNGISANNTFFKGNIFNGINSFEGNLDFSFSVIKKRFIINHKNIKIKKLNLEESVFKNKVKLQFLDINVAIFYNTKFKNLADFYGTTFEDVNISRVKFDNMAVFTRTNFYKSLDFKYVKFF